MTNSRTKGEVLSETTKTALRELWIKEVYDRQKYDTANKYTDKGIMCEPDAMDLLQKVTGKFYPKNLEQLENEYITGTPDIIISDLAGAKQHIIDIKCSWDIWTFAAVDEKSSYKSYYYQQLGYMWLTGVFSAELDYCLVNTPEEIMTNELYKLSFRFPELSGSDEALIAPFKKNYIFDDIPEKERVKIFPLTFIQDDVNELMIKIEAARRYMADLKL